MARVLTIERPDRNLALVVGPTWPQIATMLARDTYGLVRFALVNGTLVAGPASDVDHRDICEAYLRLLADKPDASLRIDALGQIYELDDVIAFDLQTVGIDYFGVALPDVAIKLDAAVRRMLRGCNQPLGWVRRDQDPRGRIAPDPSDPIAHPVILPRPLGADEIALINSLAERRKAHVALSEIAYVQLMSEADDPATPVAEALLRDGFLAWKTYTSMGRQARRLELTGLGLIARHLFLIRPSSLADPRIDLGDEG